MIDSLHCMITVVLYDDCVRGQHVADNSIKFSVFFHKVATALINFMLGRITGRPNTF